MTTIRRKWNKFLDFLCGIEECESCGGNEMCGMAMPA